MNSIEIMKPIMEEFGTFIDTCYKNAINMHRKIANGELTLDDLYKTRDYLNKVIANKEKEMGIS